MVNAWFTICKVVVDTGKVTVMKFDDSKISEIMRLVRKRFEAWQSVEDAAFVSNEITYKREATRKAQELLSEGALSRLLDAGDYEAFIQRLELVGKSTNLLYLSQPRSGDLSILYQPNLDKGSFCEAVFLLLHDSAAVEERLRAYLAFVEKHQLPQKWTFPTYFLFLLYPQRELFVKPMTTRWLVELMNGSRTYPWTPSAEAYTAVRDLFSQLLAALAPYGAADMIDVQSIVWVAYQEAENERKRTLAEPFASMFTDMTEAEWAFELLYETVEKVGGRGENDPRFAMTLGPGFIRLNFGNWVLLEFPPECVSMPLLSARVDENNEFNIWGRYRNNPHKIYIHTIPRALLNPFSPDLKQVYDETMPLVGERFKNWRGTPFRYAHIQEIFAAIFDVAKREKILLEGLGSLKEAQTSLPDENVEFTPRYWRITLPEALAVEQGNGNQNKLDIWGPCLKYSLAAIDFDDNDPQLEHFREIQPGDWIVAFLRDKRIGGIGEVTAAFEEQLQQQKPADQDYWHGKFWQRVGVDWKPTEIKVDDLPQGTRNKFFGGTVLEITEADFEAVQQQAEAAIRYDETKFLAETYLLPEQLADLLAMMEDKKQLIFYGPPGTGKTFVAQALAKLLTGLANPPSERVDMVQFHPAFGYEDFIEGIRPVSEKLEDGRRYVDYPTRAGIFRRFCEEAAQNKEQKYVFIIDEINRGNIPRIFGELMLLLEYREKNVRLPYSGKEFSIPSNVYLIGTMNTADRSIALVDFALRRRFHFFQFKADPGLFGRWLAQNPTLVDYLGEIYAKLTAEAIDDPNFQIGHSYFMDTKITEEKLARIWRQSIEPYLVEYYMGQKQMADQWRWEGKLVRGIRARDAA